jgi:hypothetical protein
LVFEGVIGMNSNHGEDSGAAAGTAGMLAALAYIDGVGFPGVAADLTQARA